VFGSLSRAAFLERHWQRAPIMFRGALPGFRSPISAEELAGLACEEDVESRLVEGAVSTRFRLEHGPFDAARFERLPERDWTLLVQDVDKFVPALAPLLEPFRFIPEWRIDDIMVSFAAPGGSVGPHTDQYDVFLLQARGRRRWQLSKAFDPALRADSDLKVLEHFSPEEELIAEPGDVLYLPPNVAHFGLALDEAMTFSVGFRAPDQKELMVALAEELIDRAAPGERFSDAGRSPVVSPTELVQADLARLRQMLRGGIQLSDADLDGFIGRHLTRSKPNLEADGEVASVEEVRARLVGGERLVRRLGSRWAHCLRDGELWVFAEGQQHRLDARDSAWIEPLLGGLPVDAAATDARPGMLPWLVSFLERGAIEWQGDDD
jgi:50S ribosomal protein L16 3-hydroxylase